MAPLPPSPLVEGQPTGASTILWLAVSWLWVGVPLVWGVWETIVQSMPLFR